MISFSKLDGMRNYGIALICGSFANIPLSILFVINFSQVNIFIEDNNASAGFVFLIVSLIIGFLLLEIAVVFESVFDKCLCEKYSDKESYLKDYQPKCLHLKNWENYLLIIIAGKEIAHSLIGYLIQRFVFLLAFCFSLILFTILFSLIGYETHCFSLCQLSVFIIISILLSWFLIYRAYQLAGHLSYLRYLLNNQTI